MDAKVSLTKETKKKTKKPLDLRRIGELRWQMLEEAEKNGELEYAHKRIAIAKLVGINDYNAGYSWVANLIRRKAIIELPTIFAGVYEYHLGKKPYYKSGRHKKVNDQVEVAETVPQAMPQEVKTENNMVVTITQEDTTIKIENIETKSLIELVNNMRERKEN